MKPETGDASQVPFLKKEYLRSQASGFLQRVHPTGTLPVPVELIVERQGIDIIPIPDLRTNYDIEGFTKGDLRTICVDQRIWESSENRYRFTLAHEMGHIVLHRNIFHQYQSGIQSTSEWIEFVQRMSDNDYLKLEYQAYCFAGLILVPTSHLVAEFGRAATSVRGQIETAVSQGIERAETLDFAWQGLVRLLTQPFQVSAGVIERRLKFEGLSTSDL